MGGLFNSINICVSVIYLFVVNFFDGGICVSLCVVIVYIYVDLFKFG